MFMLKGIVLVVILLVFVGTLIYSALVVSSKADSKAREFYDSDYEE